MNYCISFVILSYCLAIAPPLFAAPPTTLRNLRDSTSERMLVVSGGGARGAWGVGVLDGLTESGAVRYTSVFGTSTGSLIAPLILVNDMPRLIKAYTGVRQENIFNVNPFKISTDADGSVKSDIRFLNAVWRLIARKNTMGETLPLLKRIRDNFTEADYNRIVSEGKELSVSVTNVTSGEPQMKSSKFFKWDDMCHWIWASANEPVWMSFYKRNDSFYVDGGVRNVIPLRQALRVAFKERYQQIDVVINNSREFLEPFPEDPNQPFWWLKTLVRTLEVYNAGTVHNDVAVSMLMKDLHNKQIEYDALKAHCGGGSVPEEDGIPTTINVYFMPQELAKKYRAELAFFPEPMAVLMKAGKESVQRRSIQPVQFKILNNEALQKAL